MDAGNADGVFPALSNARLGVCGRLMLEVLIALPWPYTPKASHKGSHRRGGLLGAGRENHWEGRLI